MSSGDVATQLLNWPRPSAPPEHTLEQALKHVRDHGDDGLAQPWDERVPPPGQDATLLAVVPIPGTGMSLAVVGYAIATSPPSPPGPATARTKQPGDSGLHLNHGQRRVWAGDREIPLTFREFELLAFLSAHPTTVFTRADLVERVWHRAIARDSQEIARDSRTVDVHVSRIRRKLGPRYGQCLVTEYRVGYLFRPLAP